MKGAGCGAKPEGAVISLLIKSVSLDSEPVKSYFIFYYLFTYLFIGKLQASIFTRSLEVRLGMENHGHSQCCSMGNGAGFLGLMLRMNVKQEPSETKAQGTYHKSQCAIDFSTYYRYFLV